MSVLAYIALGSNLGRRRTNLRDAIEWIGRIDGVVVRRTAAAIESEPVDCPPGSGRFLNTVIEIETTLDPESLLTALLDVEHKLGRVRRGTQNEPRCIDLDIALYGDRIIDTPRLTIPHARLAERRFVLEPLASIDPAILDPRTGRTVQDLLAALA